jgi:hypothetical protein
VKPNLANLIFRLEIGHDCVVSGFNSWQRLGMFLFTTMSRLALGPTQPPIQWVLGTLTLGVKWLVCEAVHLPLSSAEIKNAWSYTCRENFTITFKLLMAGEFNFNLI